MFPTDIPPTKYWNCWEQLAILIIFLKQKEDEREISILFYKRITNFHYIHLFNIREIWRMLYPRHLTQRVSCFQKMITISSLNDFLINALLYQFVL